MLTADQFDLLLPDISALYEEYNQSIINDMARRLGNLDFASAAWQMQRLTESGMVYKNALKELAKLTGKSEKELRAIFKKAGVTAMQFDDAIYKAAGLNPLPLNLSPAMLQVLTAGLQKTQGILSNLTMTTAISSQQSFIKAADLAYMQVANGAMSYDQAIGAAVKKLADEGVTAVNYASGHVDQLDVAMRRTVLTGVSQTAGQLQMIRADEMGVDLVAVSAHGGARPSHAKWQGQIFSRSGTHKGYKPFVESTGYGTGAGLGGWNCRHSFYPFFEGLSENAYSKADVAALNNDTVTLNGQEMSVYDATQYQRGIERDIRKWKRRAGTADAVGQDNSIQIAKMKQAQAKMRDFISQMNGQDKPYTWYRQGVRERVTLPKIQTPKLAEGWISGTRNIEIGQKFIDARNYVGRQEVLSHLTAKEIAETGSKIFLSADRQNGFIISVSGDIQNLFSLNHMGKETVQEAIRQGGRTLDCFDGFLSQKFYPQFGFVEIRREANWVQGQPDVVFMELKK